MEILLKLIQRHYTILGGVCKSSFVESNNVTSNHPGPYNSGANQFVRGIYADVSQNCLISCNTIYNVARCLEFNGTCTSTTSSGWGVVSNFMNNAQTGLRLSNNGSIGQQGDASILASGNTWSGTPGSYSSGQTYVDATSTALSSKLFCSNTSTTLPTNNQGPGVFYFLTQSLFTSTGTAPSCPCNNCNSQNTSAFSVQLQQMVQDTTTFSLYNQSTHWMRKNYVFRTLQQDPSLMQQNSVLQNFYSTTQTAPIGSFTAVDTNITTQQFSTASSINTSVSTSSLIEQNQQQLNAINLQLLMNPAYQFTMQDSIDLAGIANQCPLDGGNAVIQARNLMMLIADAYLSFGDPCSNPSRIRESENSLDGNSKFKLYPNPNNGNMTLEYDLPENTGGEMILYDITGQIMCKNILAPDNNAINISCRDLSEGAYFCCVKVNGVINYTQKVIIIK